MSAAPSALPPEATVGEALAWRAPASGRWRRASC